ncbi:MAG: hypothetical protein FWD59_03320 [Micrococcales bacterium]|nr:hypothetical protein [Micrococcales bacterium]
MTTLTPNDPDDADLVPLKPNPGSELDPANCVGRDVETAQAREMLDGRMRIVLSDPRRMGKTLWMKALADNLTSSGAYRVVMVDYQGVNTTQEFLRVTVDALVASQHLSKSFLRFLKSIADNVDVTLGRGLLTIKKSALADGPLDLLVRTLTQLGSEASESKQAPFAIMMDEVPDAVLSIAEHGDPRDGKNLLQRLRRLRHAEPNIRWIIAGSVGFHHVRTACGAGEDVTNDLVPLPFGPLNEADAAVLTRRLALGIGRPIDHAAVTTMVSLTGGMPYLIQKLVFLLRTRDDGTKLEGPIGEQDVRASYASFLANRDESGDAAQFVSRITRYYRGGDEKLAFAILDWFATGSDEWRPLVDLPVEHRRHDRFLPVFENLVRDHYLQENDDGCVRWRYGFIRAIYQHRRMRGTGA